MSEAKALTKAELVWQLRDVPDDAEVIVWVEGASFLRVGEVTGVRVMRRDGIVAIRARGCAHNGGQGDAGE